MVHAHTSLFYGLSVKGWTLVRAAKAHPVLVGPLLALDLIDQRLGLGTLQTSSGLGAQNTPTEIWEIIRAKLCSIALKEAESTWVKSLRCDQCVAHGIEIRTSWGWPSEDGDCDACFEIFSLVLCDLGFGAEDEIKRFLAVNGLTLPIELEPTLQPFNPMRSWAISLPVHL